MAVYFDRKDDYNYICWASNVKKRDHYTCVVCGRHGGTLHSHHLASWADNPDKRFDLINGICLCQGCHTSFHDIYGRGRNTPEQFKEFEKTIGILIKLSKIELVEKISTERMLKAAEEDLVVQNILNELDGYTMHSLS